MLLRHETSQADTKVWLLPSAAHTFQLAVRYESEGHEGNVHLMFDFPDRFQRESVDWFLLDSLGPDIEARSIRYTTTMDDGSYNPGVPVRGRIVINCDTAIIDLQLPQYDRSQYGPTEKRILEWKPYRFNGTYALSLSSNLPFLRQERNARCRLERS